MERPNRAGRDGHERLARLEKLVVGLIVAWNWEGIGGLLIPGGFALQRLSDDLLDGLDRGGQRLGLFVVGTVALAVEPVLQVGIVAVEVEDLEIGLLPGECGDEDDSGTTWGFAGRMLPSDTGRDAGSWPTLDSFLA